jgi:uncharacterized membrane protein (UPF0182 family)
MIKTIIEYGVAMVIIIVVLVFYWYSRNIVSGYYELLWFQNVEYSGVMTKFLLIIPALVFSIASIFGIMRWRRKKKSCLNIR